MRQHARRIEVSTRKGLLDVTEPVRQVIRESGVERGLCTVFLHHTSASLVVQENADPRVLRDLEVFLSRLVPEGDALYTHVAEGPDDMPGHVRAALTRTSESIPVRRGELDLGTWQALYVWEHRRGSHRREMTVHVVGE